MNLSKSRTIFLLIFLTHCQQAFSQYVPFCDNGKWGYAARDGEIVIDCIYDKVGLFSDDDLAKVKKGEKYGYINKNGMIVIPIEYDSCSIANDDRNVATQNQYIVLKNKKFGALAIEDGKSKVLIPVEFSSIGYNPEVEVFICLIDTNKQYFSRNGQSISKDETDGFDDEVYVDFSDNGYMPPYKVKTNVIWADGKVGVVKEIQNPMGKISHDTLIPIIYDGVLTEKHNEYYEPDNDVFGVKIGEKWGMVKRYNKMLLPVEFDSIDYELNRFTMHSAEYQQLFVVMKNNKWGVIGKKNESVDLLTTIIPYEYDKVFAICNNYLCMQKGNKYWVYCVESQSFLNNKSYSFFRQYDYDVIDGLIVLKTINKKGQTVFLGTNGVEFYRN